MDYLSKNKKQKISNFNNEDLKKFIGKNWNSETEQQILKIISPYTIDLCDEERYYLDYYCPDTVRCLVENGIIQKI